MDVRPHAHARRGHLRLLSEPVEAVFAGVDDDADDPVSGRRRTRADRLDRLLVRAALYASPSTPCSAQEVADALGMREGDVRRLNPAGLRRYGRSLRAPFSCWLDALHDKDDAPPPRRRERIRSPRLRPLGGPKHR
ncbi:MAG: hypothetical protein H6739_36005 [Alphaproteobacteria bacterium]|nr:hypothetical protein [Alphaproteobacteria bacterium]